MALSDFGNLKKAFITFDSNGRYSKRGRWAVARGGYDLWFEIYYDGTPILDCIAGEIENEFGLSSAEYDKVCDVILSINPSLKVIQKFGYDIICHKETNEYCADHLAMDSGDMTFDTEADAWLDAKETIEELINESLGEYSNCTPDDFEIEVYRVD